MNYDRSSVNLGIWEFIWDKREITVMFFFTTSENQKKNIYALLKYSFMSIKLFESKSAKEVHVIVKSTVFCLEIFVE